MVQLHRQIPDLMQSQTPWSDVHTQLLQWPWLWLGPTFHHRFNSFHFNKTTICSWRVDLTSMIIPPMGAIRGMETNNVWILVKSLCTSKLPPTNPLPSMLWPRSSLQVPHIVTTNKIESKKVNYNYHRIVGQLRAVLVVGVLKCTLSLLILHK